MRVESRPVHQELLEQRPPGLRAAHPAPIRGEIPLPGGCDEQDYVPEDMVRAAAEAANKIASVFNMTVEFAVHEETGFEMLQIIDSRTNVVIREMPPHEILDMIARMWEAIGVFVDKTA
jgi:hypothetical protein